MVVEPPVCPEPVVVEPVGEVLDGDVLPNRPVGDELVPDGMEGVNNAAWTPPESTVRHSKDSSWKVRFRFVAGRVFIVGFLGL